MNNDFLSREQNQLKQMLINSGVSYRSIIKITKEVKNNGLDSFYALSPSDQDYLIDEIIDSLHMETPLERKYRRDLALSFIRLAETFEFIRKNKDALTD